MAEETGGALPDFDSIKLSEEDRADISTASMAQNVAAFRSLMLRYENTLSDENLDLRRLIFVIGETLSAMRELERGFAREMRERKAPSMPLSEYYELKSFIAKVPRRAIHRIAKRYPYAAGPFVADLRKWTEGLPESEERATYFSSSFKAQGAYEQMIADIGSVAMLLPVFLNQAKLADDSFKALLLTAAGGVPPPGMPPTASPQGPGGDGDLGRRVSGLESAMGEMARDVREIAVGMAAISESVKHLATKEDLAIATSSSGGSSPQGAATKEDLTPLASEIAWIKERLRHVPTKFGLVMAAAVPVASGLWWIFQQVLAVGVK